MLRPLLLAALLGQAAATAEEFVPHQPTHARLFLRAPDDAPPLRDVRVAVGDALPGNYEPTPEKKDRLTDINFPIHWWKWKAQEISFTPSHDGTVELDLNGPWGEARPGVLRQQEVLWDDISATGATVENGGFEEIADGRPAGWDSPWRPYPAADVWPLANREPLSGKCLAASWHGRPLVAKLAVKKGVPVVVKLHARAATTPDFREPRRLSQDTPAHRAAARLKRGVNFGNGWEASPGTWGIRYTVADVDRAADEGFDHLRIPVAWHFSFQEGAIDPALLAEIEPLLRRAMERKLVVMLNWHHYDALCKDPATHAADFRRGWGVIATYFRDWPEQQLYLELLNEPNGQLDGRVLADVHAGAIAAIREVSATRIIVANPPQWASVPGLDRYFLPDDDDRILTSIHSYEPFPFTHQRANWVNYQDLRGISYPGPPSSPVTLPASLAEDVFLKSWIDRYQRLPAAENPCGPAAFTVLLDDAAEWSKRFGRAIHIGEFGCFREADAASRSRYVRDFRLAAEKRGMPWAMWDWKAGFAYWDESAGRPLLREELFGGAK